jgi:hypothetical protein
MAKKIIAGDYPPGSVVKVCVKNGKEISFA